MLAFSLRLKLSGTRDLPRYAVAEKGALADPGTLFPPVQITKRYQSLNPIMQHAGKFFF